VEQHAHVNLACARVTRAGHGGAGVGEHFERQRAGVVGYAHECWLGGLDIGDGEAEEGGEIAVSAELDGDLLPAGGGDGAVEELLDLSCKRHPGDGTHVVAAVVGQAPFVHVGELGELKEDVACDDVAWVEGGVVDLCDVDEVPHYGSRACQLQSYTWPRS